MLVDWKLSLSAAIFPFYSIFGENSARTCLEILIHYMIFGRNALQTQ